MKRFTVQRYWPSLEKLFEEMEAITPFVDQIVSEIGMTDASEISTHDKIRFFRDYMVLKEQLLELIRKSLKSQVPDLSGTEAKVIWKLRSSDRSVVDSVLLVLGVEEE